MNLNVTKTELIWEENDRISSRLHTNELMVIYEK